MVSGRKGSYLDEIEGSRVSFHKAPNCFQRDPAGEQDRIAVSARGDGRKRDAPAASLNSQLQALRVAVREESLLASCVPAVDRADRVNDVFRLSDSVRPCQFRMTSLAAAKFPAFFEEFGTGGTMDGTINAASAQEGAIRGINDRIHWALRDVSPNNFDHSLLHSGNDCRQVRRSLKSRIAFLGPTELARDSLLEASCI